MAKILTVSFPSKLPAIQRGKILARAQMLMYVNHRASLLRGLEDVSEDGDAVKYFYNKTIQPAVDEFTKCLMVIAKLDSIKLSIK